MTAQTKQERAKLNGAGKPARSTDPDRQSLLDRVHWLLKRLEEVEAKIAA